MKIQSGRIKSLSLAGLLAVSSIVGAAALSGSPSAYAAGQTCTWTGAGTDNKFSTVANWTECGGAAPTNGDALVFDSTGLVEEDASLINDISGLTVGGMTFKRTDDGWRTYNINLGTISLDGNISLAGSGANLEGNIGLSRDVEVTKSGSSYSEYIDFGEGKSLRINTNGHNFTTKENTSVYMSELSGTGTITSYGGAYGQGVDVKDGTQFTGAYVMHDGARFYVYPNALNSASPITVDNASLAACGIKGGEVANPLTIGGSIYMDITCSGIGGTGGDVVFDPDASVNWTGPITLTSNVEVAGNGEFKISGALSGNYTIEYKGDVGRVVNNSPDNTSNTQSGAQESEGVEVKLDASNGDSFGVKVKDTGVLTGTYAYGWVYGMLKGTGTVTGSLSVYRQGTIAPGMSPGCLTVGSLSLSGTYQVEFGGKDACSGYDQIRVTGVSGYSNPVDIDEDNAVLALYGFGDFVQAKGDTFVIIDNQTDEDVQGTFKDLPEGAEVKVGDAIFTISYKGGDGNDVVLTAQNSAKLPGVPNTGIAQIITANPVIAVLAGLLTAGAIALASRKKASTKA